VSPSRAGIAFVAAQLLLFAAFAWLPRVWRLAWDTGTWGAVIGWGLVVVGIALGIAAGVALGRDLTPFPEPRSGARLVTAGPYRHARHPIYGGLLLAALGWTVASGAVAVALLTLVAAVFFNAKRRYEERSLRARFRDYDAYRSVTRVFVPFLV
jgi:protein-S-isoprenylcysteine O-methyltransferase Ste14